MDESQTNVYVMLCVAWVFFFPMQVFFVPHAGFFSPCGVLSPEGGTLLKIKLFVLYAVILVT